MTLFYAKSIGIFVNLCDLELSLNKVGMWSLYSQIVSFYKSTLVIVLVREVTLSTNNINKSWKVDYALSLKMVLGACKKFS